MIYKAGSISITGVKNIYTIVYQGKGVSTNSYYAGASGKNGWRIRSTIKKKYNVIFRHLLAESNIQWMDEYFTVLRYNSRMDPDNTVGGICKLMLDSLKQERESGLVTKEGWVYDDSKTYLKGVMAVPDTSLANDTFIFDFLHLK